MDKTILEQYIDACELVKETEQDIMRLRKKKTTVVMGGVKGSNPEFPYQEQHFHLEGIEYTYNDDRQLRMELKLLEERKAIADKIKIEVEEWMAKIPVRMQRIIRYKFFEGLPWERVADKMGRKSTGDGLRKEFERFMSEK